VVGVRGHRAVSYYEREATTHLDGTPIFQNEDDRRAEREVGELVAQAFGCRLGSFGRLTLIDWYAERNGRLVGLLELKARSHATTAYPTVFLNVRKWMALWLGAFGLGVPSLFVVRFTDDVRWIALSDIDARSARVAGCKRTVKSETDVEPVIEVPVGAMKPLRGGSDAG
jgi:hypothetical protein